MIAAGRRMGGAPDFPTDVYAPNLSPTALGDWTDGEIYRAIASGVDRNGWPIFPVMPCPFYRSLDPEDVRAVIAYLRSLPPQPVMPPRTSLPMPLPLIMSADRAADPCRRRDLHAAGSAIGRRPVAPRAENGSGRAGR